MRTLSIKNIDISFDNPKGDKHVLFRNFSQEFTSGIYTLLGESGCGKTTLMRAIEGFQKINSGSITLDGKLIDLTCSDTYMMHQHYANFSWLTVEKNLYMAYKARGIKITDKERNEVNTFLKCVGLEEEAHKKVGTFAGEISGGQSQRLAFILGIAFRPKVYMLDEPTSALDRKNAQIISDILQGYQRKMDAIIIVITHDIPFAKSLNATEIVLTEERRKTDFKLEVYK